MATLCVIPTVQHTRDHAVLPMDGAGAVMLIAVLAANLVALPVPPLHQPPTQQHLDPMLVVDPLLEERNVMPMVLLADAVRQLGTVGRMRHIASTAAKVAA